MLRFILINVMVIVALSMISYKVYDRTSKNKKTYKEFIVGKKMSTKGIMIGLSFGIVFGFLDNLGLLIGMDTLTKNFKMNPNSILALAPESSLQESQSTQTAVTNRDNVLPCTSKRVSGRRRFLATEVATVAILTSDVGFAWSCAR